MKQDDVQQLAQSFVASWETQLARALREPHMLSSLMGMMQQGGYASGAAQSNNPWATAQASANPFASSANPFAGAAAHASSPSGFTPADTATHAESGAAAGPDHTQRIAALEYAVATLSQRVAELEQQLANESNGRDESAGADAKRTAKTRSRSTSSAAATGAGSRKAPSKKA